MPPLQSSSFPRFHDASERTLLLLLALPPHSRPPAALPIPSAFAPKPTATPFDAGSPPRRSAILHAPSRPPARDRRLFRARALRLSRSSAPTRRRPGPPSPGCLLSSHRIRAPIQFSPHPTRPNLFCIRPGAFAEFANAETLERFNTFRIARDVMRAQPGDLLFYRQGSERMAFHTMVFVGPSQIESGVTRTSSTTPARMAPPPAKFAAFLSIASCTIPTRDGTL